MKTIEDFHPYQHKALEKVLDCPSAALFLDVGLGKTVVTLTALRELRDRGEVFRTLICAPLRVCQTVWEQECREWDFLEGQFTFARVNGYVGNRIRALHSDADILLVNYENLMWLREYMEDKNWLKDGGRMPFDMVVMDELSKVSNPSAKRSAAIRAFVSTGHVDRRLGLTATPATNGLTKLFGEYLALDSGKTYGTGYTRFKFEYFTPNHDGTKWLPRRGAPKALMRMARPITYAASKKDYLDLPAVTIQDIRVNMSATHHGQYRELERDFFTLLDNGEEVEVFNAAAKSNKCLQFANGAVYRNQINRRAGDFDHIHDVKLDALAELYEGMEGKPLLVCYSYKMDGVRIKRRFPEAVDIRDAKDTEALVNSWNRGELPLMTGHPAAMGHGLNLQRGGHHLCWFGLNWDLELYDQAIGRLDRQGQTNPVLVHRILMDGTLDAAVALALTSKAVTQHEFLEAIRQYRRVK